ncbi:ABC transporter permease [Alteromonas sp. 5E99-2]|uniref:ABC transporter permease n=1 Tax=Alteromonas sp. 5E99-2 TaxID=2817683 RepID=UPI001F606527|nr:ABC transporter permease [Alteromonas sp. 5E99-2]
MFPGDPLTNLSGVTTENAKVIEHLANKWAIDTNPIHYFMNYCSLLLQGDWGISTISGNQLAADMARVIPATIELSIYSAFIAICIGVPLGCIAGIKAYTKIDYSINAASIIQYSTPVFWSGLAFILIFCFQLKLFPLSGRISVLFNIPHQTGFVLIDIFLAENIDRKAAFMNCLHHMVLPSLAVGLVSAAALARLVRRSVIDVLNKPYISAARSRGLPFKTIFFNHVLRNSLLPVLPLAAIQITTLITNAMIIEVLFSWPGVGNFLLQAIYQQDYSALRIGMLVVSTLVISLTIFADLLNRIIDPKKGSVSDVSI